MKALLMGSMVAAMVCAAGGVAVAQTARTINFGDAPGPVTVTGQGVEVTLQPKIDGDSLMALSAAVRVPGYQAIIVDEGTRPAWADTWVAIGKLSASDPAPAVLIEGFTGGAHCCATLTAIVPNAGRLKVVAFEPVDGDSDKVFPKDLDGDGTLDFERQDDAFRYQFASGAGSFSPPLFYNIYKGQLIDVSGEPGFRSLWTAYAAKTRAFCLDKSNTDRNGACAAWVAAAARLGQFDAVVGKAVAAASPSKEFLPMGCSESIESGDCPAGKELKFATFETAIKWFLRSRHYID